MESSTKISLRFVEDEPLPAKALAEILEDIDRSLFELEWQCLLDLPKQFEGISYFVKKRAVEEFKNAYDQDTFSMMEIQFVGHGSSKIFTLNLPLAGGWILNRCFAETLGDPSLKARWHDQIKKHFAEEQPGKIEQAIKQVASKSRVYGTVKSNGVRLKLVTFTTFEWTTERTGRTYSVEISHSKDRADTKPGVEELKKDETRLCELSSR